MRQTCKDLASFCDCQPLLLLPMNLVLSDSSTGSSTSTSIDIPSSNKPLRICLLGYRSHPYCGGQGIYIHYLSKALADRGHIVDVISGPPYPHLDPRIQLIKMENMDMFSKEDRLRALTLRDLKDPLNIYEWFSVLTGGFPEPYTFGERVVRYLKKRKRKYDIIHDNQSLCHGLLKIQKMGIPLVTTIHHPITRDRDIALSTAKDKGHRTLIKRWYSFLKMQEKVTQKLDNIITVSECSRQDIANEFKISAKKVKLVYNGIDTEVFKPRPDIERSKCTIMATASADAPLKGLQYLIEAIHALIPKYPDIRLHVLGKPKEKGSTERQIKRLGMNDRIQFFTGIETEELAELYTKATMVVVPSIYEGFGLPAGEAMSSGTPVISTTGGALSEIVGDAGILIEPKQPKEIATAIDNLLKNPEQQKELSQKGRQRILDLFCWKRVARSMEDIYQGAITNANR
ncbi:MAG: glycosyltransferase involved in cell wall biosynthesis [bacterium]|jgi:glycosyltransferase involved in cell wall biosynthesis